jgi:hypothetical protein
MSYDLRTPVPERVERLIRGDVEPSADDILMILELRRDLLREKGSTPMMLTAAKIACLIEDLDQVAERFQKKHEGLFT